MKYFWILSLIPVVLYYLYQRYNLSNVTQNHKIILNEYYFDLLGGES